MAVPSRQELRLPILRLAADGEVNTAECAETLAAVFQLSAEERAKTLRGGRTTVFRNLVSWAVVDLSMAALIEKTAPGRYAITDQGKRILDEKIEVIDESVLQRYRKPGEKPPPGLAEAQASAWVADTTASQAISRRPQPIEKDDPVARLKSSHAQIMASLRAQILERVRSCSPSFFERLVIDLLVKMGYGGSREDAARAVGRSGDEGIDGVIKEDRLGLDVIYVQAKRYSAETTVGRPELQRFAGSLDGVGASKGIFFTTSSFTAGAQEYAERLAKNIILIDGRELADLLIEHHIGVKTIAVYPLKRVDDEYFVD